MPVHDVKFCLVFQRETLSVPVMRRVLGDTLRGLGVDDESVYDILLAATEACTNVLTHSGRRVRDYAVVTSLGAVGCQVEVRSEEHTSELQSRENLVCRLLLEKKKKKTWNMVLAKKKKKKKSK